MKTISCKRCGKETKKRNDRDNLFCSISCANKSRQKQIEKTCPHCEKVFLVPKRHSKQKYCSTACHHSARTTRQTVACAWCGTHVVRRLCRIKRFKKALCSDRCKSEWEAANVPSGRDHPQYVERITVRCYQCNAPREVLPCVIKGNTRTFCGKHCLFVWQCESGYMTGPNHPNWIGGHKAYRGPNWRKQRKKALERDGYQCQHCGINHPLDVHHKVPYRDFGSYLAANRLDNLITLCDVCHTTEEWKTGSHLTKSTLSDVATSLPVHAAPESDPS
jgi:5-methylcytosine-specific restriction endonuclease McrA